MKITTTGLITLMTIGSLACAGDVLPEADVGSLDSAVTAAQCSAYAVNGQVTVCHVKPNGSVQSIALTVNKCIQQHVSHAGDTIAVGGVCAPITCTGTCGDTSGPGGANKPCCCGDTVTTATVLNGGDPVTGFACSGNGLTLGAGVALDLGGQTVAGGGAGTGVRIPNGGTVRGGTVRGFGVGVLVDSASPATRASLGSITVRDNAGDGVRVLAAPGASNLDGIAGLAAGSFGFETGSELPILIQGNGGYGIHVGDAAQSADVSALLLSAEVSSNALGGVLLEQRAGLAPGADCGASAGYPGCSGATIANLLIRDNGGPGAELRSGFIIPYLASRGFVQNIVAHNAMAGAGCVVTQSAPQILISGPVGLGNAACGAATDQAACAALSSEHCVWEQSGTCRVAWDLRGASTCVDASRIHGYNAAGGGALDVGARAVNFSIVDLRNNFWLAAPKVTVGGGAFIDVSISCGGVGCGF